MELVKFSSWPEVMAYAKAGRPLYYQAPMDQRATRFLPGSKQTFAYSAQGRTIRLWPGGSIGRGKSRTHDPFNADSKHLDRFSHPTEQRVESSGVMRERRKKGHSFRCLAGFTRTRNSFTTFSRRGSFLTRTESKVRSISTTTTLSTWGSSSTSTATDHTSVRCMSNRIVFTDIPILPCKGRTKSSSSGRSTTRAKRTSKSSKPNTETTGCPFLTETFDGWAFKLSPQEFVEAIRGTDAEKLVDVEPLESEEEEPLEESPHRRGRSSVRETSEEKKPLIRTSYSSITRGDSDDSDDYEEDHGWIDEEGTEFEPDENDIEDGMTPSESIVAQAVKFLKKEGASEASSSHFHPGIWYSTEYETIDYGTGEEEERSFHLEGFSPEEQAEIFKQITQRRR